MTADALVFDEADLNAFADGRLEPGRAAALAESLNSDRVARARIDGWKRQNEGLRTLFAAVLFEPVPVRLLPTTLAVGIGATPPVAAAETRTSGGTSSATILAATALGVAIVGFLAGVLATVSTDGFGRIGWGSQAADVRLAADDSKLAERATEAYLAALTDPIRPTELSAGDEGRLQNWMMRQLSGLARIPDLRPQGWTLLSGHVVQGRLAPAAFLAYGHGAERLGLYLARDPVPAALRTAVVASGAVVVSFWSEGGLGTAVTSTRDLCTASNPVEQVCDAVHRQVTDGHALP